MSSRSASLEIIDAHQHCWQLGRPECTWPGPELAPIHRDFEPQDFWREAAPLGVIGSVLVQSQPHRADTDFLLELAERWPAILGVVGWTDLSQPDAPENIRRLAKRPWLSGLRPMLEALPEDNWILGRAQTRALSAMAEHDLVFDALIRPRHLPVITALADRRPNLTIVVDHAAKPPIVQGELGSWRTALKALAERPNVHCKLSGLATEMGPKQPWRQIHPYIDTVLELFGPQRVLWGSDWPVLNLAGDYQGWLNLARERVASLCPGNEAAVFRDNARRVYRLAI